MESIEHPTNQEEIVERSIFGENQFNEMIQWIRDRQNLELQCQITGKWSITGEFFKGHGRILKRYDGSIFPTDLYILLDEGDIGKEQILIGRRIVHIQSKKAIIPFHYLQKIAGKNLSLLDNEQFNEAIDPNVFVIENHFKKDMQSSVFFRAEQDFDRAITWLQAFTKKYEVSCHIEGVLIGKDRQIPCIITGTISSVEEKEFFVQLWDAFDPYDPLNDDTKEWLSRDWVIQVAQTGINKLHPHFILFEVGEELALTKKVLSVQNLKVTFGNRTVIHDVNFEIQKGEILGIIGESGAGKTTTLKAILGEIEYTGSIYVFGIEAHNTKAIAPFIGYVPQDLSRMYGNFNCLENIVAFGRQYGIPDDILIQRGKKILKDLGIAHVANQPVDSISGGQKRRASIAIAMVHNPYLLFLDEPTSGLDPLARYELWNYLDVINKEYGITLCVISHYLDEIEYSDKACIFLRGVGFYDYDSPDGLKHSLPGKGLALEVTLEEVSLDSVEILQKVEGVEFAIQRGERIRLLSTIPSGILAERVLKTLEEHKIAVHSIEYKVEIDMVDYFTFVSVIHNTQAQDITGTLVDSEKMKTIIQSQKQADHVEEAIGFLPAAEKGVKVNIDGKTEQITKPKSTEVKPSSKKTTSTKKKSSAQKE
jgi:ABC-type multidrug transport system ATPase subunit